ncbi:MAG: type II and III secretion system protein family protein [Deltaproteobacteria bacterium]|jgi:pilus assembly protein CpaC|nr:type II and III secretion system protein family protein [Deltaproteobacteria bacterium]
MKILNVFPMTKLYKIIFTTLLFLIFTGANTMARNNFTAETVEPDKINLVLGKSIILIPPFEIQDGDEFRVQIGSPEIADILVLGPNEIYIKGKKIGTTNMILSLKDKMIAIYDIEVKLDLTSLKLELQRMMPNEKNINVIATNKTITLYGKVSNTINLSQALALAKSYAPKGKINNLLEVGGTHQVMLEVKMAEMSRSVGKELGFTGEFAVTRLGGELSEFSLNSVSTFSPAVTALFRNTSGHIRWTALINALKENSLIKILAEPNLIALSGQTASFLAGGEFPIPVSQGFEGITIEYRKYGIGLSFTPSVLDNNKISIEVESSVSELDFSTAVQFQGFVVPALTSRNASTMVELGDGQSFAIAGLLSEKIKENVQKFPLLGDIPILGALFKSTSFQKNETELIIIVTPRLVKPMNAATQPVPTDYYVEPDDSEIFLNIKKPVKKSLNNESLEQEKIEADLDGQFGHSFETE